MITRTSRVALAATVLGILLAGTSIAVVALAPGPANQQPQYTVASSEGRETVGTGTVVVAPSSRLKGASEKLTLVAVGGLLLGLAAAVRRTT